MPNKQMKKKELNINKEEINKAKKPKKKHIIRKILGTIILMALLGVGSAFILTSPFFNITSIKVTGNEKFQTNKYINMSKLELNRNIFNFKKSDIIKNVKENPYIENVKVKRILPNTIELEITERKTKFIVKMENKNKYAYIDDKGNVLELSEEKPDLVILKGIPEETIKIGNKLDETYIDRIKDVIKIQNTLNINGIEEFNAIDISNKFNYILIFEKEAKYAYIGDTTDLETKVLYMKYILEEQAGIPGSIYLNQSKIYFSPE